MLSRRPDAVEVVFGLRIGSCPDRHQARRLARDGVTRVVDLRAEADDDPSWPNPVRVTRLPMTDHGSPSVDDLRAAAGTVEELLRQGEEVLIHCRAGLERAPTVACAVLMLQGWSLGDAFRRVRDARPEACPTDGQMAALRELEATGIAAPRS